MKKIAIIALYGVIMLTFSGCCLSYDYTDENGLGIGYSELGNSAFISEVNIKKGDSFSIILPDEYNGIVVKDLGGCFGRGVPCPFYINIDIQAVYPDCDECYCTDEEYLYDDTLDWWDSVGIIDCEFTITLPSNLENIVDADMCVYVAEFNSYNGTVVAKAIRPTVYLNISEDNKNFYTENGKLYDKHTKELIDGFIYKD